MTMPDLATDASGLAQAGATVLAQALEQVLHLPGQRERHRRLLEQAVALANRALALATDCEADVRANARAVLLEAQVARARDARHGAGQLSLGAQRAPTRADCEDGWRRVETMVAGAEAAAAVATDVAAQIDTAAARRLARDAEHAAGEARRIVDARNHAYTFHADPGFSFGEGWYLAAAAVLDGVAIQIEPDKAQTAQAERFLRDAGLATLLRPYRSRPRANKHLPEIIARAFRADAISAQRRLRAAFLGDVPASREIRDWIDARLAGAAGPKVLLWIRHGAHQPNRNTSHAELVDLAGLACGAGLLPVLVGDALRDGGPPEGAIDLTLFWKDPIFQGPDMRRTQLHFFEHLRAAHGLIGQVGVTTAGMDGPALMGLPTMYLTDAPNPRLGTWVAAVPGYREIVRDGSYRERVGAGLRQWADVTARAGR